MARTIKLSMTIQSHLSDALIELEFAPETVKTRLRFIKWLINKFEGNLDQEVDIEAEYKLFGGK